MLGVFLDRESLDRGDLDLGPLCATLPRWELHPATGPEQVAARIAQAQVVVTNKVVLDATALAAAPELRLIAVAATGTNNVDLTAARERGVAVCNVRGYATPSVVEHVFGVLLTLVRRLDAYRGAVAAGRWAESEHFCLLDFPMGELSGATLGIVGYGELGRAVATAARAFGMNVVVAQRPGGTPTEGRIPLDDLLAQSDVVSLHCPLTSATRGLIGARELGLMRRHALLINSARGGIVDEPALVEALRAGRIGGAAVDVLSSEPPRGGNPLLAPDIPNLVVTPHVAWASRPARQRLTDQLVENISAFLAGNPRNLVE